MNALHRKPSPSSAATPSADGHLATAEHVPLDIFPADAGLILADGYGAELVREAPEHQLHAATRKSVTLAAAGRLQGPYGSEICKRERRANAPNPSRPDPAFPAAADAFP